jgi:hypothetical protein
MSGSFRAILFSQEQVLHFPMDFQAISTSRSAQREDSNALTKQLSTMIPAVLLSIKRFCHPPRLLLESEAAARNRQERGSEIDTPMIRTSGDCK